MTMRKTLQTVATLALIGAVAAGAIFATRLHAADQPAADPVPARLAEPGVLRFDAGAPQLSALRIETAVAMPLPMAEALNGRLALDENRTARISSPIAGRVLKLVAEPGDRVARNAVLLQADAPELAAADADWRKAQADEVRKKLAYERARNLLAHEVVPQKDVEAADADYRQAAAESRRTGLRMRSLHASGAENGSFSLRTPLAGVVVERQVTPGMELRPDLANPLFVVSDPSRLWLLVDVPERSLAQVRPGQKVSLETDAFPGARFSATVDKVGYALDPATRRVQVRCTVENPDGRLRPEMYARVSFLSDNGRSAIAVPNAGLVTEGINTYAFVEASPGVFRKRQVGLALRGRETSHVDSGLQAGDRVVVEGALLLNAEMASHAR
ncbi:efflux RND transporter periplasmic adaptor subunit [Noviherbaspirillum suwonense]|uniref:Membrane fusion protein, cobalt-zinc-cadmium efflux system n=1 Tax=Noviherbaspirillum suwonense TaxID=1224511 RepID=A0ABY1QKX8_9BURK|nr:efflux RND transporter periplasmic adaptor subunit [Noviherbaspirillum suwonense]SMP74074.1 membrane fusion protein, cobalt-zinc-cadmium efflux system [Noviherbaspirillum suwonense]